MKKKHKKSKNKIIKEICVTIITGFLLCASTIIPAIISRNNTDRKTEVTSDNIISSTYGNNLFIPYGGNSPVTYGDNSPVIYGDNNSVNIDNTETNKSKSVAKIQNISLEYLQSEDNRTDNIYLFDLDRLPNQTKKYYLDDNCCTKLLVSNNSDNEYQITKFSFYADNIKKDLSPYFEIYTGFDYFNDSVILYLNNDGWGNANNVEIEILDEDSILTEYFYMDKTKWEVTKIEAGEVMEIEILSNEMLKKAPESEIMMFPTFSIASDETKIILKDKYGIRITPDGIIAGEFGASASMAYGIYINTDQTSYSFTENISENIKAKGLIDIPICFYTDMSCDLDFYIELEIFDGEELFTVKTDTKSVHFQVSHNAENWNFNGETMEKDIVYDPVEDFISYPFSKNIKNMSEIREGDYVNLKGIINIVNGVVVLQLNPPIEFENKEVYEIQLANIVDVASDLLGKEVDVTGKAMAAHTQYHMRDMLITDCAIYN